MTTTRPIGMNASNGTGIMCVDFVGRKGKIPFDGWKLRRDVCYLGR
jgi:hypothetical protein